MSSFIPKDSLVLVTGSNGYIGAHICDLALAAGLRVRGVARSLSRLEGLQQALDGKYGAGKFQGAAVEDYTKPGAFDKALEGVAGVIHVATVVSFSPVPEQVIGPVVDATKCLLASVSKSETVKRFIYTSTVVTQKLVAWGETAEIGEESWWEESLELAYSMPPDDPIKGMVVYAASKILSERACWEFVEKEKPGFDLNTILVHGVYGKPFLPGEYASTSNMPVGLFKGDPHAMDNPVLSYVDVVDTAALHVQALLDESVSGRRIPACGGDLTPGRVVAILRELYSTKTFVARDPDLLATHTITDTSLAEALLHQAGRKGWTDLKETIRGNVEGAERVKTPVSMATRLGKDTHRA